MAAPDQLSGAVVIGVVAAVTGRENDREPLNLDGTRGSSTVHRTRGRKRKTGGVVRRRRLHGPAFEGGGNDCRIRWSEPYRPRPEPEVSRPFIRRSRETSELPPEERMFG